MDNDWDTFGAKEYQEFSEKWGKQALRVLKPGAYALVFSGTRTVHRMAVGLEDAGFRIKNQIYWLYGSGFPKGKDISKAIDKHLGVDREKVGEREKLESFEYEGNRVFSSGDKNKVNLDITKPATEEAKKWHGYNTALKPAAEPIVLVQKPKEGSYVENVLEYGTGAMNIEDCRIPHNEPIKKTHKTVQEGVVQIGNGSPGEGLSSPDPSGRWPSNVILDPQATEMVDEQSGESKSTLRKPTGEDYEGRYTDFGMPDTTIRGHKDQGGASRFFYCAKPRPSERNAGLEDLEGKKGGSYEFRQDGSLDGSIPENVKNDISTLKPISLMRYLCRLITPPDGIVLDPFAGSGTTGIAAVVEGFDYFLIEKRERFANLIAPKRIDYWSKEENQFKLKEHSELESVEEKKQEDLGGYW